MFAAASATVTIRRYNEVVKDLYTLDDLQNWAAIGATEKPPIRLGIFGDPVAHSLSPQMQNAALRACGIDVQYARLQINAGELEPALRLLVSLDFVGANLTIPHKIRAAEIVDEMDDFARAVGAINCVRVHGEKLIGSNTDGPGFARAIRSDFSVDLRDLRVLLLGAGGGAGRAIAMQCAIENCERLVLVNRTLEKAAQLARELRGYFREPRVLGPVARIEAAPWSEVALRFQIANSDLLINATSLGMNRTDPAVLPPALLAPHLMVYDTVYQSSRTPLLSAAAGAGARGANGLSMLLHQGALAFEQWFGRDAPVDAMRAALVAQF